MALGEGVAGNADFGRECDDGLRRHGSSVQADISRDPSFSADPPRPARPNGLQERRSRLAQAHADRTAHRCAPPAISPSEARPIPPQPAYPPTVRPKATTGGRSR